MPPFSAYTFIFEVCLEDRYSTDLQNAGDKAYIT
jgi:hypothetical protein